MIYIKNSLKILFPLFLIHFIFIPLAFCFKGEIKIGVSLSLTGKYSQMGIMQKKGFDLWVTNVNKNGGILDKKIILSVVDDKSSPERAREIYENFIENEKLDLVIGPYSSSISEAILPIIEKYGYPTLLSGASADRLWEKGYKYAFGVYTPASKYTVGFLQMLVKTKLKNIAIVSADDTFSVSLSKNTAKWAKRFSLNIKSYKIFDMKNTDLSKTALFLKDINPDVVIVCGHFDESVNMRRALKKVQWYPAAYYASVGPALDKFKDILGKDSELVFSSSQWEKGASSKYPFGEKFLKLFYEKHGKYPSYHAATAYGAGMILETALRKTGSFKRESVRNTLAALDTMTLIGRYGVDSAGKQRRHFPLIIQWQNGNKKVVWPDEIKTSNPVYNKP